ncbi:MAG: YdcF family protein [Christensenellaceae bacterium]|nr:YdcF family protein [Christensenellaceae bacterium]
MKKMLWRIVLIIIGAALILNSLFVSTISSINLGVIMPFIIGLPLLVAGLLYGVLQPWWQTTLLGKLLKWGMVFAYAMFGLLLAVTTTLILVNSREPAEGQKTDVLIVLGAGIKGESPTVVLRNRLDRAVEYYEQNSDITIVVSGGQGTSEVTTEASVMKRYLVANGIPEDRIIEEGESQSTEENFLFSYRIIKEKFGANAKIAFVTTRFHVFRARLIAKKQGIEVFGIAAPDFSLVAFNNYLRECAAITQYAITGKI